MALRVWTLVGSSCLATVIGPRGALAGSPASTETTATPTSVSYDLTAIPDADDADALRAAIERAIAAANQRLAEAGTSTDAVQVKIGIQPAKAGFRATLEGRANAARKDVEIACIPCSESELVESIQGRYEALAAELAAQSADASSTSASSAAGDTGTSASSSDDVANSADDAPSTDESPPRNDRRGSRGLGPVGIAGVVALGVGVTSVGVGIGLAVKPDEIADPTPGVAPELRSTHTPGYALLGIGSAAVITGVALVVVDRVKAKRASASRETAAKASGARRLHAAPWANPLGGGVVLSGRF
jgi:hypothetical protein